MSSPIANPQGRPMAQVPTSPPPGKALKTFGQDYRYAETLQNPFPEVVFSSASSTARNMAPTSHMAVVGGDGATEHGTRSSLRPDTAGSKEPVMHEDIWVEPADPPWYKAISKRRWAAIIICTVGITGVVLAILGAMNKLSGGRSEDTTTGSPTPSKISADLSSASDPSRTAESSSTITSGTVSTTSTTSSAGSTSTPTPPAIDCDSPSTFATQITWIGTEVGAYKGVFAQASSASACCTSCLTHTPGGGCAGWLYNQTSAFTPCTKIIVSVDKPDGQGQGKDDKCPSGYATTTFFAKGEDGHGGVAGMGPCGLEMRVQ